MDGRGVGGVDGRDGGWMEGTGWGAVGGWDMAGISMAAKLENKGGWGSRCHAPGTMRGGGWGAAMRGTALAAGALAHLTI